VKAAAAQALSSLAQSEATLLSGVRLPRAVAAVTDAADVAMANEPVYGAEEADDVQGNVVPGFNKDHQEFLFLAFGEDVAAVRAWLSWLAPRLASMAEVLSFRAEFRAERLRRGLREPTMSSTWISVAFSYPGLRALVGENEASAFGDQSFRQGLLARSGYLGDPTDPDLPGHPSHWVVGGPDNEADALVIVAADDEADLDSAVEEILAKASEGGLRSVFRQRGDTLPGPLTGHEHFGFKDGVSQPAVRGQLAGSGQLLSPRYLAADDPHSDIFAKPGQHLVWPGQFLLGEPRQDPQAPVRPAAAATTFPSWARRGSYLVCRRLEQDVEAFWDFAASAAERLGLPAVNVATSMVGRWPSGAPLLRTPGADDLVLAGDEFANNHFLFDDETRPSSLKEIDGYPGDKHPAAAGDLFGRVCPHAAHIRKVNPRDSATDFGAPADTFMRLMLRRGIPYGPPIAGETDPDPELVDAERGLVFVAFMSSVEDQFEFVSRRWCNSEVQPNLGGPDPVIGQRDRAGDRTRVVELPDPDGELVQVEIRRDFVVPTGGGYFFAPPISAVSGVLAGVR
jgi:Dyp-type peroxidase family